MKHDLRISDLPGQKIFRLALCLFAICFASADIHADESFQALFDKANRHFEAGEFEAARDLYRSIEKQGCHNAKVDYNLGNAYLKLGDVGRSILYFLRASRIAPRDKDVKANLEIARSLVGQKITPSLPGVFSRLVLRVHNFFTMSELTVLFSMLYITMAAFSVSASLASKKKIRRRFFRVAFISGSLFVLSGISLGVRIYDLEFRQRAVAVGEETVVRNGPGEPFAEVYKQQPGYEMSVKRHQSGYAEVVLSNGYTGWVPEESIEIL
jgi:tetratricopeptide (TPR) repeat protein